MHTQEQSNGARDSSFAVEAPSSRCFFTDQRGSLATDGSDETKRCREVPCAWVLERQGGEGDLSDPYSNQSRGTIRSFLQRS